MTDSPTERVRILLASTSPRRRELLTTWCLPYIPLDPEAEEITKDMAPTDLVRANARLKADAIRTRHSGPPETWLAAAGHDPLDFAGDDPSAGPIRSLLVGVDTEVVHDGHVMGKPRDADESRRMLSRLSGRTHEVLGGLHLSWLDRPELGVEEVARTRVTFRTLAESEIDWYVGTGEGSDKAGSYGIQGHGGCLIDHIEGCYFNVVGFPVALFVQTLARWGLELATIRRDTRRD